MKNRRRILTGGGKKFLWIYESGDSKLQNCSYSLTQGSDYLDFPPSEVGSTQLTDFFRYRYVQNEETSPSTAGFLDLSVTKTFAGFKKLCFEAKKTSSKTAYIGIAGVSETRNNLTTGKTLYEIDLTAYQTERVIRLYMNTGNGIDVYNMWLE